MAKNSSLEYYPHPEKNLTYLKIFICILTMYKCLQILSCLTFPSAILAMKSKIVIEFLFLYVYSKSQPRPSDGL